jgi:hypothetical protein
MRSGTRTWKRMCVITVQHKNTPLLSVRTMMPQEATAGDIGVGTTGSVTQSAGWVEAWVLW